MTPFFQLPEFLRYSAAILLELRIKLDPAFLMNGPSELLMSPFLPWEKECKAKGRVL